VSPLRFAYFMSGEIITALTLAVFAFYIMNSFIGAETLLDNESRSESTVVEIYAQEKDLHAETGTYGGFEELAGRSARLAGLRRIPLKDYDSMELAADGEYFYLIRLVYSRKKASDLVEEAGRGDPIGFHCLSWPVKFALTGETCLYVNETGGMAVAPNIYGAHDGYKSFPLEDFSAPAQAAQGTVSGVKSFWYPLDELPR